MSDLDMSSPMFMYGVWEPGELAKNVELLEAVLSKVTYKDWRFRVHGPGLVVTVLVDDSMTGRQIELAHVNPIPRMAWRGGEREARRWLLERVFDIERHEAMEHFLIDGRAPFFPNHDPDGNPYGVHERDEWVEVAERPTTEPGVVARLRADGRSWDYVRVR